MTRAIIMKDTNTLLRQIRKLELTHTGFTTSPYGRRDALGKVCLILSGDGLPRTLRRPKNLARGVFEKTLEIAVSDRLKRWGGASAVDVRFEQTPSSRRYTILVTKILPLKALADLTNRLTIDRDKIREIRHEYVLPTECANELKALLDRERGRFAQVEITGGGVQSSVLIGDADLQIVRLVIEKAGANAARYAALKRALALENWLGTRYVLGHRLTVS
ncbi:MAG: hypothetical protein V1817_04585 [Candidatus Micrarchaeota archaeon]